MKLVGPDNLKLRTSCNYLHIDVDMPEVLLVAKTGNSLLSYARRTKGCVGLASNQVGIMRRVCVAKINNSWKVFINPRIIESKGHQKSLQEACLSFPGIIGDIKRAKLLTVSWWELEEHRIIGFEDTFQGRDAIIMEHEIDHLNGIRCIDKMKHKKFLTVKRPTR